MGGAFVDLEADPEPAPSSNGTASGGSGGSGSGGVQQRPAQKRPGRLYVPEFNSAVFFRVPRYHR